MARTMSPFRYRSRKTGLALLVALAQPLFAVSLEKEFGNNVLYTELSDPYYFSSGLYLSLLKSPIPTLGAIGEKNVYRRLLSNLFKPNCLLFEVGAYPLPLAGVAAKAWAPKYYVGSQIMGTNVIQLLTESVNFKEPWSFSIFCGNMAFFKEEDGSVDGHGNIGLLATYGYFHIKDNSLIPDHWGEFELKLKVDKSGSDRQYGISYRAGARLHSAMEIKNFFYLGFNRDRTDFSEPSFSFYKNVAIRIRGDCSIRPIEILALSVEAGKKRPFKWHKHAYAVGLSLGATWNIRNAYSGKLGEGFVRNSVTPIIKPMLNF
jgi:hypothetical protein